MSLPTRRSRTVVRVLLLAVTIGAGSSCATDDGDALGILNPVSRDSGAVGGVRALSPSPQSQLIAGPTFQGGLESWDVSHHLIVWGEGNQLTPTKRVHVFDVLTETDQIIWQGAGVVRSVAISSTHVAWIEAIASSDDQLWLHELATQETKVIQVGRFFYDLALSSEWATWILASTDGDQVVTFNIASGLPRTLVTTTSARSVDIDGERVIWKEEPGSVVLLQDLADPNSAPQVLPVTSPRGRPRISGHYVIVGSISTTDPVGWIDALDLQSGMTRRVATTQLPAIGEVVFDISGDRVVWLDPIGEREEQHHLVYRELWKPTTVRVDDVFSVWPLRVEGSVIVRGAFPEIGQYGLYANIIPGGGPPPAAPTEPGGRGGGSGGPPD